MRAGVVVRYICPIQHGRKYCKVFVIRIDLNVRFYSRIPEGVSPRSPEGVSPRSPEGVSPRRTFINPPEDFLNLPELSQTLASRAK